LLQLDLRENGASRPTDIELKSVYAESSEVRVVWTPERLQQQALLHPVHPRSLLSLYPYFCAPLQDCIRFQLIDGRLDLIETEFVKGLSGSILPYLTTFHSIPAFLATVTLDLFGRTTQAM
jgi:hypothetical protein